jgi:hypothetical protein
MLAPDIANSNLATGLLSVMSLPVLSGQVQYHISFLNSSEIKFECYRMGKDSLNVFLSL